VAGSSLDLSDRAVLGPLARLLAAVRKAAGEAPLLLVGAAARDLLLVHAHGVDLQRATEDTDLALAVRSWDVFLRLLETLIATGGFTADVPPHRLWFGDQRLDIIPFDGVERADRSIVWPTQGAEVMNVAGLTEALATAVSVRLPGGVVVDVASLPAIAFLKIWAWNDKKCATPGKDASHLWMLLRHYADAGNQDRLYFVRLPLLSTCGGRPAAELQGAPRPAEVAVSSNRALASRITIPRFRHELYDLAQYLSQRQPGQFPTQALNRLLQE